MSELLISSQSDKSPEQTIRNSAGGAESKCADFFLAALSIGYLGSTTRGRNYFQKPMKPNHIAVFAVVDAGLEVPPRHCPVIVSSATVRQLGDRLTVAGCRRGRVVESRPQNNTEERTATMEDAE